MLTYLATPDGSGHLSAFLRKHPDSGASLFDILTSQMTGLMTANTIHSDVSINHCARHEQIFLRIISAT